jgi:hypothetical protein
MFIFTVLGICFLHSAGIFLPIFQLDFIIYVFLNLLGLLESLSLGLFITGTT